MARRRGGRRPDGRPSEAARARLSHEMRREMADLEVRIEEVGLRVEALLALGHEEAAAAAVAEQQELVEELRARLGRKVSAAVVERDAEAVVAAALADARDVTAGRSVIDAPRRHPVLVGAASTLAVLVAVALSVLPGQGPDAVDLAGADDVTVSPEPSGAPPQTATTRPPEPSGRSDGGIHIATPRSTAPPTGADTELSTETAPTAPPTSGVPSEGPDDADSNGLTDLVEDLLDVVNGVVPSEGELDIPLPPVLGDDAEESESPSESETASPTETSSDEPDRPSLRSRWNTDDTSEPAPEPSAEASGDGMLPGS